MKTLGIIPARKGSQRFPDKHHALLLGKPMFEYTLKAAAASRLDRVVVSSDDRTLKALAERHGAEFIERPAELCTPTAPLEEALRHACRFLKERDGFEPDIVVTMLGNVPVRKPGQIDQVVEKLKALPEATAVCTACELRARPEWAKVLRGADKAAAPFLPGFTGYRMQDYPKIYLMDGAVAAVRRGILFSTQGKSAAHAWFGEKAHLVVQENGMHSLEVDYPDQRALAEFYLLYQRFGDGWLKEAAAGERQWA